MQIKNLVCGLGSQAENSRHAIFSFNPISLFDLKAHFFAPTRIVQMLSRAGAVKVGRRSDIPSRSSDARPYLDSPEHGSTLVVVGMTSRGELACRARTFVPQPCIRWAATTRTMMQSCASAAKAPRRRAHSAQRHESHGFRGTTPPRTVIGDPSPWCGSSRNRQVTGDLFNSSCSSRRAHGDTLRNHACARQPPQRDQQLAGQCHNHGLAGFR